MEHNAKEGQNFDVYASADPVLSNALNGMFDNKDFEIKVDNRDYNRTPMQWDGTVGAGFSTNATTWLPIHANYGQINLKAQKEAEKSTYKFFKSVATLRKEKAFIHGGLNMQIVNKRVFAYSRCVHLHLLPQKTRLKIVIS